MMSTHTTSYDDPIDSILSGGIWLGIVLYFTVNYLQSYWYYALLVNHVIFQTMIGHCAATFEVNELGLWAHSLITGPAGIVATLIGNSLTPQGHAGHHYNPLSNFALYSTYWDDRYGTAKPANTPQPFPLMCLGFAYGIFGLWIVQLVLSSNVWVLALIFVPRRVQAALLNPVASWVTRVQLWDRVRVLYQVTYAEKGAAGEFKGKGKQRYIFCYHPQNIIARGAWYTFAGAGQMKGWGVGGGGEEQKGVRGRGKGAQEGGWGQEAGGAGGGGMGGQEVGSKGMGGQDGGLVCFCRWVVRQEAKLPSVGGGQSAQERGRTRRRGVGWAIAKGCGEWGREWGQEARGCGQEEGTGGRGWAGGGEKGGRGGGRQAGGGGGGGRAGGETGRGAEQARGRNEPN